MKFIFAIYLQLWCNWVLELCLSAHTSSHFPEWSRNPPAFLHTEETEAGWRQ